MKKLIVAMALGAALAWLFDPDNGVRRREQLRHTLDERGLTGKGSPPVVAPTLVEDAPTLLTGTR